MLISLVCVYNNREQLENQLMRSLEKQTVNIERIMLDNCKYKFKSAAQALNYGASVAKGDVLIFSHQDIYIKQKNGVEELANAILNAGDGCIVGTQGVREKSRIYYSNLTAGEKYDAQIIRDYEDKLIEVSCVDEGLFGMKKSTWENHKFDEKLCDNWHLYAVEMCLYARKNKNKVYVYPIQMHHFSYGTISKAYMDGLKKMCVEYRRDFKYIWTTCYKVKTNPLYMNILLFLWITNRKLRKKKL